MGRKFFVVAIIASVLCLFPIAFLTYWAVSDQLTLLLFCIIAIPTGLGIFLLFRTFMTLLYQLLSLKKELHRQEGQALVGRVANDLVHDLKHPIQTLKNCGNNLDRAAEDPVLRETLKRNFDRELQKINQFLYNLEHLAYDIPHHPVALDLCKVLDDVIASFEPRASEVNIAIRKSYLSPSISMKGDLFSLNRIFSNLISNAFDAVVSDGVVTITASVEKNSAVIDVADTGRGIAPERLSGLFENYWTTKHKGIGFGLAICKKIALLHHGRIAVKSTLGKGTCFKVVLPLKATSTASGR